MRLATIALLILLLLAGTAGAAESPLVAEVRAKATRYHEDLPRIDAVRTELAQLVKTDPQVDNLIALAQVCFIWGDVRARTPEDKLAAYEQGREAAKRAVELAPRNAAAHFWHGVHIGRWGQTKGAVRSLFLLPTLKQEIATAMELDPTFPPVYSLAGSVYFEVPGLFGGDLDKAEQMFRKSLELDPRFTGARVGLARVLIKKGRIADARRELETVLVEKSPTNLADWTVKDSRRARELLASLKQNP